MLDPSPLVFFYIWVYLLINVTLLDALCYHTRSYLLTDGNINPNSNGERHEQGPQ